MHKACYMQVCKSMNFKYGGKDFSRLTFCPPKAWRSWTEE